MGASDVRTLPQLLSQIAPMHREPAWAMIIA